MPFLTEELWQNIQPRKTDEALIIANYPTVKSFDETIIKRFANTQEAITAIRGLRSEKGMSPKEALDVFTENKTDDLIFVEVFKKLGNVQELLHEQKPEKGFAFRVGTVEFLVPVTDNIDLDAEREKLTKELTYFQEFLQSVRKKLSNEKFVQGAPEAVVNAERKKESDALEKIAQIEEQLASYNIASIT